MTKDEIIELIDALTVRLEGPAERVFELAVRHETVAGWTMLAIVVVSWVLVAVGARLSRPPAHECSTEPYRTYCTPCSDLTAWRIAVAIACGVMLIVTVAMTLPITERLITPEWVALRMLVPGI